MPTNRSAFHRQRTGRITPEVLDLFRRLSAMPKRPRPSEWKVQSQRLAELLGLENEWWALRHVEDEPDGHPPAESNSFQHACYWRVAEVRERLLAAVKVH
jgi:hypothetical protein